MRHLAACRPAVRTGRRRHVAVLPRGQRRPTAGGRHHRSGLDGLVHRCRHRLFHARDQHDPVLHLLLDVRLPAHRRPDLGRLRLPGQGLPARRHGRPHHAGRRRLAAPGRAKPAQRQRLPTVRSYDPAFAYEITTIILDGMRRMYEEGEDAIYYLMVGNENYRQPPMPEGVEQGILRGIYKYSTKTPAQNKPHVQLFGSGAILREVLRAQDILAEKYGVSSNVWSVTSYTELARDAVTTSRWNMLHPTEKPRVSFLEAAIARGGRPVHRRLGLCASAGRTSRAVRARRPVRAGHRRLRTQRNPQGAAAAFRSRCRMHYGRHAVSVGGQGPGAASRSSPKRFAIWASIRRRSTR